MRTQRAQHHFKARLAPLTQGTHRAWNARSTTLRAAFFLLFALLTATCRAGQNPVPLKTDNKNPVVLVHGIKDDARKMEPMAGQLRREGRVAFTITLKPCWGEVGIDELAGQLARFIDENIPITQKFDLIGFSMGGLVSRFYLQRMDGLCRVDHFITLATPHRGTLMAWLAWNKGGSQMRPNSVFLRDLNQDIATLGGVKFTSIWTPLDLMIIPAGSSRVAVGSEIKIWMPAHPLMVLHPKCIRAVAAELQR